MAYPHHYRSGRTWVWILVITLVLLPILAVFIYRVTGDRALQKRIDALKAQGHPVTLTELNDRYPLPLGVENAADYYMQAFDHQIKWDQEQAKDLPGVGRAEFPVRTDRLESSMKALLNDYLLDNQETLSSLHEAAVIPNCRYPVDFTDGLNTAIHWLGPLRESARLLQLQALMEIDNNDVDAALHTIQSSMALGRSLQPNTMVEQLVRNAVFAMNLSTIERLLNQCDPTDAQLESLSSLIQSEDVKAGLYAAVQGECCIGLAVFRSPSQASVYGDGIAMRAMGPLRAIGYLQRDAVTYLDFMQKGLDYLENPTPTGVQELENVNHCGLFSKIIIPALTRVFQITNRAVAQQRTTIAACAIERYRLAHRQLPETLEDLMPAYLEAVPLDPFDGKPLRYLRLSPGYVVYSVGEDLSDDGGQERVRKSNQPWDVTFIVER